MDQRGRRNGFFGVRIAILVAACGACDSPEYRAPAARPTPLRLADLLAEARIDSPLTEIPAVQSVDELGEIARETIFAEDFEDFDPEAAGWPPSPRGIVAETDRGRAFRLRGLDENEIRQWIVPAEPNTRYHFERLVNGVAPLFVDFAVLELREEAERKVPIRLHWPRGKVGRGWQRGSVSFRSRASARWLQIQLMPNREMVENPFRWLAFQGEFDALRLDRLQLTPRQEIALLKGAALAPGADPELGIHKRGQFPPRNETTDAHAPEHNNFSHRYALYAPAPTDLAFAVEIQPAATLRFSTCLARETPARDAARFEVVVRCGGQEHTLWSDVRRAGGEDWRWHDASVPLAAFVGQTVELVLRTRAETGTPHPMWGNPVIEVPPAADVVRNVILIAVDTLRADRLSSYGYAKKTSPNLDALAADGVRFENVASNSTWTSPAFASILTGVVPSRHQIFDAAGSRLPPSLATLAERFRAHGWATQSIVYKAPLYHGGYDRGFDVAFNVPRVIPRASENLTEAMAWLERSAARCNFLFLHFDDPHQPFNQPPPFDRTFGDDPAEHGLTRRPSRETGLLSQKVGNTWPRGRKMRNVMRGLYDGEVAYVDNAIGVFLDALRSRGLYDDAVIAFVADHGEELWDHGRFGHGQDRLHDEVVRVPLIVKPRKGTLARGKVVATQVRGFDVMPTLLELAGIAAGDGLDAESLVPLLLSDAHDHADRVAVSEVWDAFGLRTRDWKYILRSAPHQALPGRPLERLHDLRRDPAENKNVALQHPDVVERLRVRTLDYILTHRHGRYLVAVGDRGGGAHSYRIRGARGSQPLYGIRPKPEGTDAARFEGKSTGPLVLVTRLTAPHSIRLGDTEQPVRFPRYRAGDLRRLLDEGRVGIHALRGPPDVRAARAAQQTEDLELMEDLRAVGYVGGRPGGDGAADNGKRKPEKR